MLLNVASVKFISYCLFLCEDYLPCCNCTVMILCACEDDIAESGGCLELNMGLDQ